MAEVAFRAGDLNYNSVAPWVAWELYFWANSAAARSDGLARVQADFQSDDTHRSQPAQTKVVIMLLNLFNTSHSTKCWLVTGATCP